MSLPIRTTVDDIDEVCAFLATKPTGATTSEAKAVIDKKRLDGRKITALKFWELIEEDAGKMKLTDLGRQIAKDGGVNKSSVLRKIIRDNAPYAAIVERAAHSGESTVTAVEVAAHWHEHFKIHVSDADKILNDQAVCYFQIAQGADLGQLIIGRKGQPTRFDFDRDAASRFAKGVEPALVAESPKEADALKAASDESDLGSVDDAPLTTPEAPAPEGNRVFITHGKNKKILEQIKQLVAFGKFEPMVSQERESSAKPVPDKVMDDMRSCKAAVIHVSSEGVLFDGEGNEHPQINGNVLIEIGAAMALYGRDFILLVEEGMELPSNLQGLYECRYKGDELNMDATMKLLKAFSQFK